MASVIVVKGLVDAELARMPDPMLREQLRDLLIEPQLQHRDLPDGPPGGRFPTWLIARSLDYPIGLGYTEFGYGPTRPWGYISVNHLSLGDSAQWHPSLEEAFRASGIWRRA